MNYNLEQLAAKLQQQMQQMVGRFATQLAYINASSADPPSLWRMHAQGKASYFGASRKGGWATLELELRAGLAWDKLQAAASARTPRLTHGPVRARFSLFCHRLLRPLALTGENAELRTGLNSQYPHERKDSIKRV